MKKFSQLARGQGFTQQIIQSEKRKSEKEVSHQQIKSVLTPMNFAEIYEQT
jgi:hypothetical protein